GGGVRHLAPSGDSAANRAGGRKASALTTRARRRAVPSDDLRAESGGRTVSRVRLSAHDTVAGVLAVKQVRNRHTEGGVGSDRQIVDAVRTKDTVRAVTGRIVGEAEARADLVVEAHVFIAGGVEQRELVEADAQVEGQLFVNVPAVLDVEGFVLTF